MSTRREDVMIGSWFVVLATVPLAMGIAGGSICMSRANTGPMPRLSASSPARYAQGSLFPECAVLFTNSLSSWLKRGASSQNGA